MDLYLCGEEIQFEGWQLDLGQHGAATSSLGQCPRRSGTAASGLLVGPLRSSWVVEQKHGKTRAASDLA